nr:pirin family protein [Nocardioides ginsengisegetis]
MPVTVEIRRATQRFRTRDRGRDTRHSFAFGEHYDPDNLGFGPLVCHDEHLLGPGVGFPEHRHSDLEIVTWVLDGAVEHTDSTGAATLVRPGMVQVQSAGTGITHAEVAATGVGPTRFVQAWLRPETSGGEPSYDVREVALVSGELVEAAAVAGGRFLVASLAAGDTLTLPDDPLQHVYVGKGALIRSSLAEPLSQGDAFRFTDVPGVEVTAAVPTELLVWTFPG